MNKEQAARPIPDPRGKCDHICLKDGEHVERGEPHFYGYENPSPRALPDETPTVLTREMIYSVVGEIVPPWVAVAIADALLALGPVVVEGPVECAGGVHRWMVDTRTQDINSMPEKCPSCGTRLQGANG